MATTIYALCEPDLQVPVIRYIGKSINVAQRFREHLKKSSIKKNRLGNWIRSIQVRGERPVLLFLTEVPNEMGSAAEMLYIRLARDGGMDLVNATDGGEGAMGRRHTPETRAAMSAAKLGKRPHNFGTKMEEEQKVKIGDTRRARGSGRGVKNPRFGTKQPGATSSYLGVYKKGTRWLSRLCADNKKKHLGTFLNEEGAARAYDAAAIKFYGPTAKLNFPIGEGI